MAKYGAFNEDAGKKLLVDSLKQGDVLLKEFDEADHLKFFIIAGMSEDKIYICSVFINSSIHPILFAKQHLLNLQVPIKKDTNPFLKYDSFVNCAYPMQIQSAKIADAFINGTCKVIGTVCQNDLDHIQYSIINSGLLSDEEIERYFSTH